MMCKKLLYCLCTFIVLLSLVLSSAVSAAIPGLIGWYRLDDGTGTIATDSSGLGNHGNFGPEGNPQWVAGIRGGAVELDGNDDYIEINAIADDIPKDDNFSVCAWIQTTMTGDGNVIGANNSGSSHDFIWGVGNSGGQLVEADSLHEYPPVINDGQWHHIAYVRDGTTAYAYTDGILVGTETPSASPSSTMVRWSIGQEWDSSPSDEFNGLVDDVQFYNRPLSAAEVLLVMIGIPPGAASNPSPENEETDVFRDTDLSWTPGQFVPPTNGHRVYLSDSFTDVNEGTSGFTTTNAAVYDPGRLNTGTTYYWRVDEVNAPPDSSVHRSEIWSFTTEPLAYPIDGANIVATASSAAPGDFGPDKTIDGSGLDDNDGHSTEPTDMWLSDSEPSGSWLQYEFDKMYKLHEMLVWNSNQVFEPLFGFGMKEVTVEYSTDGATWTALADVPEFTKASGLAGYASDTTVNFGGAAAKYVKLTATSNWGGVLPQYGLSEVRFLYIPLSARKPSPDPGATDVAVDGTLSWRPGRESATHSVYVSTDQQAVIDGTAPAVSVTDASYSSDLNLASTYYWRVDEVNDVETPTTWQSDVWDFATQEYIVVDDFEDYNDYPPHEIYTTWVDGYEIPGNGSQVGNLSPPLAETTIVHGGMQSMPFFYSNTGGATYSEGTRTFAAPQNWTLHGVTTLVIWFQGAAGNTGQMYAKINGTKITYDGSIGLASWQPWSIDLAASGASLQSVNSLSVGVDGNGAAGTLYFDDIGLHPAAVAPLNEWRIADDSDDIEERIGPNNGAIDMTSSDVEMPYEDAGQVDPQIVGLRFTGIPIPQGTTITDAWVRFQVDETKEGTLPVNLIIQGELSPSAAAFSTTAGDISSRTLTTAQVQWTVPNWTNVGDQGPDQTTPNIASIIQEIVNQPGWAGGAIVLTFRDNPANPSTGIRCAEAGPGDDAALLHIDY